MFASRAALVVLVALAALVSTASAENDAFLVLRKRVHSTHPQVLAEGTNFTVELTAYNAGGQNAYEVKIQENWGEDSFSLMEGALNRTWEVLAPGASATLNITLMPKQSGEMSGFRGLVQYKTAVDGPVQIGFSTPMLPHTVYPAEYYARATASRTLEWWVFGGGLALFTIVPFVMQQQYAAQFKDAKTQ